VKNAGTPGTISDHSQFVRQQLTKESAVIALAEPVIAQNSGQSGESNVEGIVNLEELVREVARNEDLAFLIDPRARTVFVGGTPIESPTYTDLLSILRLNDLSAVEIEGRISIVPSAAIRSYALPLVQRDDPSIPDDAWVTRVITVRGENPVNGAPNAAQLVPILRPLLPQVAHFAAFPDQNKLVVADRYANVRRITELVRELTE